jgi:phosphate transport system substrate-binding protein
MTPTTAFRRTALAILTASVIVVGCRVGERRGPPADIRYVGSSTVANFLRDAEPVYGRARFRIEDEPESSGGEAAIVEGTTEFAGTASRPAPATLRAGIAATQIGRDAIAVIVNADNPVVNLTTSQLRAIFTGKVRNWRELGGRDLPVQPYIMGEESATRSVFRTAVLEGAEYAAGSLEIRPDRDMLPVIAGERGAIGQISFSFLNDRGSPASARAVAIDGEQPNVTNFDYPIARPLYLLWREGNPAIEAFVEWAQTEIGQGVVMKRFVGVRVVGDVRPSSNAETATGTLIVYTETYPVYDGGIYYYPHRPYDLLTAQGELIRRVVNHRGENDERPMRIDLPVGRYLIRANTSQGKKESFVTIEPGTATRVEVRKLLETQR